MNKIFKTDIFGGRMGEREFSAGRSMEQRMFREGRFTNGTLDADATAPKTWIMWKHSTKGEEILTIECEIHMVPRASDSREAVGMLVGQCPVCVRDHGQVNYFHVREDNKQMSLDWVKYGRLPTNNHLSVNWRWHCEKVLGRSPRADDKVAIVSSPDRWQCDYCKGWCVRVTDSVAITDTKGATMLYMTQGTRS